MHGLEVFAHDWKSGFYIHKVIKHLLAKSGNTHPEKECWMCCADVFAVRSVCKTMKDKVTKFLKIFVVFLLFALATNLVMEIFVPTPEREKIVAEHGWAYMVQSKVTGLTFFYGIFSFVGGVVFLSKSYKPLIMGFLSFVVGFVFEFAFMNPEWVQKIYSLQVGADVVVAVIVSAFYWFIPWGVPSYIFHRWIFKRAAPAQPVAEMGDKARRQAK
ncbi:MAG: hypothetical protein OEX76_01695 [Candidatus Bathyarchaeota archaeon]|nr:hypothetical protein [Candidatus Bathyarchaeota archaeon]MDH5532048.1 hypothetical protein [Candidatus Bathyarchaeota archaeon]MDH5713315.1 hypothetical protein [Candidatus Bathyarchaeota archaeon]